MCLGGGSIEQLVRYQAFDSSETFLQLKQSFIINNVPASSRNCEKQEAWCVCCVEIWPKMLSTLIWKLDEVNLGIVQILRKQKMPEFDPLPPVIKHVWKI